MGFLSKMVDDSVKSVNPIHVITILLTLAVIVWGSWEAWHTSHMPTNLSGAAELLGGAAAANLAHKAGDIAAQFQGAQTQTTVTVASAPPSSAFPTPPPIALPR